MKFQTTLMPRSLEHVQSAKCPANVRIVPGFGGGDGRGFILISALGLNAAEAELKARFMINSLALVPIVGFCSPRIPCKEDKI